ncbi:hypothetical protein [Terriglobus aquaticus]|uniref:Uncharacterized protein n=1 Tax=Terriglobus aquaticus TaxID=940139 RepID=A0ABW9KGX0_9BACT|nr:hypothetical protein [Terriglobus aquaticus]
MLHKKIVTSIQERSTERAGLQLVPKGHTAAAPATKAWPELLSISARRCSAFFAEAAVLVLVFGVLDFFMQHGRIEGGWVLGAFAISVALLMASVGTEFSARRWLGAQP